MEAFEFRSTLSNGTISVPPEIQDKIFGEQVRVIVLDESRKSESVSERSREEARGYIDWLMENPVKMSGPPLTREEIYEDRVR